MSGRKVVIGFLAAGVIVTLGVLWLGGNLNSIVKGAVERYGGRMTQTSVSLAGVDLQLRKGRGTLTGLRIANPDGFSHNDAVSLGEITLDVDTGSITKEPLVIDLIRISGPKLLIEVAKDGSVNLRSLQKTVEGYVPETKSGGAADGSARRIAVKKLTFEGGKIELDATAAGGGKQERDLGSFTLTDLGGSEGVPADQLGQEVLRALLKRSAEQGALGELKTKAEDALKGGASGLLKSLGK